MGPEGIILVNPPNTTFQQSLTHSAMKQYIYNECNKAKSTALNAMKQYIHRLASKSQMKTCGSTMVNTDHLPDAPILIPVLI